jgi:hypothetical protein
MSVAMALLLEKFLGTFIWSHHHVFELEWKLLERNIIRVGIFIEAHKDHITL